MMQQPFIVNNNQRIEFPEGLYFGLPEEDYHSIPALSSTGLKNMLISSPDFYFNSWLNPLREEDQEDGENKEWRKFGKASHTRILEGKTVFDSLYCVEFIAPEGCLDTISDMKKALDDLGVPAQSKWKKADYIAAVMAVNPNALIFDVQKERYFRETNGRIQLTQREMRRIELAAAMIEKHPELQYCFRGGHPEVTVIWSEQRINPGNGEIVTLWFKARIDYLKPRVITELKTFTNKRGKPIDGPTGGVLYETMAGLKYHIGVRFYVSAIQKAVMFANQNMTTTYSVQRFGPAPGFLAELAKASSHEFFFVFQKKGGAPLARGKRFGAKLRMMEQAEISINRAIELFIENYALYGSEIWVDNTPITEFEDDKFPIYALEI